MPIGAERIEGGAHLRVWAPDRTRIEVVIDRGPAIALARDANGYFSGFVPEADAGMRYRLRLDGGDKLYPDPASRFQPEGPHGPSELVDPTRFAWTDGGWRGRTLLEAVIYEMHIGTFTREGTWRAAMAELDELARLGITVIEVMPIAEFPGEFGWGYDGVDLFAPYHGYGRPDDVRRFVDRAHALGIAVILDVVYNHCGPDGCYLRELSRSYFTDAYETDWGDPINFDGEGSAPVREMYVANAGYWIDEFHFDGLRLDATQNVYDFSGGEHILAAITRRAREAAGDRATIVIAENEPQETRLVQPTERGGYGIDALWNDDLHHSAVVALTGRNEAYYSDHRGTAHELVAAIKHGYLFQGQRYAWQKQRRGTPTRGLGPATFVTFLENHDQVANTLDGRRLHELTSPSRYRALTALVLLGPGTPMLFQGEEFLSSAPFLYFADHVPELAALVRKGRAEFLEQFPSIAIAGSQARLADPSARDTFERCRLDFSERTENAPHYAMVGALIALRRSDPVLAGTARAGLDGAVLDDRSLVIRLFAEDGEDRVLLVNLGASRHLSPCPEPLLAPPLGMRWRTVMTTEDPAWGGRGAPPVERDDGVHLVAESTCLLVPERDPVERFGKPIKKQKPQTKQATEETTR
jgi:maltooligosyltrehalose trehalohydrolase